MLAVGRMLPSTEVRAVDIARIAIGKCGLACGAIHLLTGVEVAFVGGPLLGCFTHAIDLIAGLIGQVRKLRGTIAGRDIAV